MKIIITLFLIWIYLMYTFLNVPVEKQVKIAETSCGGAENLQWIQIDRLGLSFGWGCYVPSKEFKEKNK